MHRKLSSLVAAGGLLLCSTACYHAIVDTGRAPGTTVVSKPWVNTFLWGLVPAKDISVAAECPNGIARVETQQTFVNGLVGAITLGIYTPQSATISDTWQAISATRFIMPSGPQTKTASTSSSGAVALHPIAT